MKAVECSRREKALTKLQRPLLCSTLFGYSNACVNLRVIKNNYESFASFVFECTAKATDKQFSTFSYVSFFSSFF